MSSRYFEIPDLMDDSGPYSYDQDFLVSDVCQIFDFLILNLKKELNQFGIG